MKTMCIIAASAAALTVALPAAADPLLLRPSAFAAGEIISIADRGRDRAERRDRGRDGGEWRGRGEGRGPRAAPGRNWSPPAGPGAPRAWGRGDFLPPPYRGAGLRDFERYRLRPPPVGYDWVQVGRDIYLMQRSTGMVVEAIPYGY